VRASATSFPLSMHTGGGDTAPAFSGQLVYLQLIWEVVFPPLLWSFPPTAIFTSFPSPGCWACATAPAFSSLLRAPCLLCYMFFCCYCLLFSFFFSFFPEWGSVCPGGYADLAQDCLWEYQVPLSSPCGQHLSKPSGHWHLAVVWEPSWLLHLT
jgi:hypothetical protein